MIIGIDAGCLSVNDERLKVGVFRMTLSLLERLTKIDKKNQYILYSFRPIKKEVIKKLNGDIQNKVVKPAKGWLSIWLPLELKKNPVDIFLGFSQSLPRLPSKTKGVVFVHDLTFEKYPQWFEDSYKKMSFNSRNAVKQASQIIAVSKATKKDLIDIYGINSSKISVIYEGFDKRLKNLSRKMAKKRLTPYGIKKPYFLFVGTFKQSKNIPNIIRAFSMFLKTYSGYQLVLVGSDYWLDRQIEKTLKEENLENSIKTLGFIPDHLLEALYSSAYVFISPSFNEGFGLTYLEALYFNLPIIAADRGATKEILGKTAVYVNPDKPEDISKAMKEVVSNKNIRKKTEEYRTEILNKFSWEKTAQQLCSLLRQYEK